MRRPQHALQALQQPGQALAAAQQGDYICIQAFVNPTPAADEAIARLAGRAREATGCVVTHGYGPRYLHSTGQLHKGGDRSRPKLTPAQREELLAPHLDDISLLEDLTGESFEQWRTYREGSSFESRRSEVRRDSVS